MEINKSLRAKNLVLLRGKRTIYGIVLHDTAGSGKHGDTLYLASDPEHRGISVDFTVERTGTIYQLNPDLTGYYTSHAGRNTRFKHMANAAVNKGTVGIEICQKANMTLTPIWPDEQVKAVAELCVFLCQEYGLKKTDITTHAAIITDGSRSDPRKWPWNDFWKHFNYYSANKDAPELADRVVHQVADGDTLWQLAQKYHTTIEKLKALNNMNSASNMIYVGQELVVREGNKV